MGVDDHADIWLLGAPTEEQQESFDHMTGRLPNESERKQIVVFVSDDDSGLKVRTTWPNDTPLQIMWLVTEAGNAAGAIGDLVGTVMSGDPESLNGLDPESPWVQLNEVAKKGKVSVWGSTGTPAIRDALVQAAGYAGISADGDTGVLPVTRPSPSMLAEAAARAVDPKQRVFSSTDGVTNSSFDSLLRKGASGGSAPTVLLYRLWQDIDLALRQNTASACASLLEDYGYGEDAADLRKLVAYWIRTNPWGQNYVPEMVGHGQAHAAAVDRNVAQLCRPFLIPFGKQATGQQFLDNRDVLELAAAAWLHDWGHGSALNDVKNPIYVTPSEARNWHGPLTRERMNSKEQGGIAFPPEPSFRFGGRPSLVALLSAHHQGWTCLADIADEKEKPKPFPDDAPGLLSSHTVECDLVRSLSNSSAHPDHLIPKACPKDIISVDQQECLRVTRKKVALLRLADAVDVGIHRAPDFETQQPRAHWIAEEFARSRSMAASLTRGHRNNLVQQISAVMTEAIGEPGSSLPSVFRGRERQALEGCAAPFAEEFHGGSTGHLSEILEQVIETVQTQGWLNQDALAKLFSDRGETSGSWRMAQVLRCVHDVFEYASHVASQYLYYEEQQAIRMAIPVPGTSRQLTFAAVPMVESTDSSDPNMMPDKLVRDFVVRELGEMPSRKSNTETPTEEKKKETWDRLGGVRKVVNDQMFIVADIFQRFTDESVHVVTLTWDDCMAGLDQAKLTGSDDTAIISLGPRQTVPYQPKGGKLVWLTKMEAPVGIWNETEDQNRHYTWNGNHFEVTPDGSILPFSEALGIPDRVRDIDVWTYNVGEPWAAFIDLAGQPYAIRNGVREKVDMAPLNAAEGTAQLKASNVAFLRYEAEPIVQDRKLIITFADGSSGVFYQPSKSNAAWHRRGHR